MSSEQRSLAQAQGRIQTSKARCAVESVPFRLTNLMVAKVIASTPTQKREGTSPATYIWGKWLYGPASIFLRARYSLIVKQYDLQQKNVRRSGRERGGEGGVPHLLPSIGKNSTSRSHDTVECCSPTHPFRHTAGYG